MVCLLLAEQCAFVPDNIRAKCIGDPYIDIRIREIDSLCAPHDCLKPEEQTDRHFVETVQGCLGTSLSKSS